MTIPIPVERSAAARSYSLLVLETCIEEEVANVHIRDGNATPLHQRQRQCCESSRKGTDSERRLPKTVTLMENRSS